MALPLKSGADLYNQQLIRAAIWNNSADVLDPKEYATGLMYFNTNPSSNMYQKLRFRTGTDWKTIAFAEDLDVATNKDFKALKEKVDLLSGEVDTDAIINNMKEVTAFLEGFAEDANLMSVLNNKLDKENNAYYGIDFNSTATDGTARLLLKNRGVYLLGLGSDGTNAALTNYVTKEWLGLQNGTLKYYDKVNERIVLHSGNVGDYAITTKKWLEDDDIPLNTTGMWTNYGGYLSAGWSASYKMVFLTATNGIKVRTIHGNSDTDWKTIAFTDSNVASAQALIHSNGTVGATVDDKGRILTSGYGVCEKNENWQLSTAGYIGNVQGTISDGVELRSPKGIVLATNKIGMLINSSGNVTIGGSDLAGTSATAKLYVDGYVTTKDGVVINAADAYNSYWEKGFLFSSNSALNAGLWGYGYKSLEYLYLGFGNYSAAVGIRINENGNVLIGATTDSGAKLQVNGTTRSTEVYVGDSDSIYGKLTWSSSGFYDILSEAGNALRLGVGGNRVLNISTGGNVGIGVASPSAQLHVANDIVANGTIACKGVAAEGSAPVGTVDKWAGTIASGTKSQTYTHALGTTDITVAIYEKNGNEWVQILTDVDIVNANTIRVTFGANTTVEHRIVVMG